MSFLDEDLYDLREVILGIEQWIGTPCSMECNILGEEDLKGWRAKPYMLPDDVEGINPEWASCLLPAGQIGHIPFLNQECQERIQSEMDTNSHVNSTNDQCIAIMGQKSAELARAWQPEVDEGHKMKFRGLSKVPKLFTFLGDWTSKMDAAYEKWVFDVESAAETHGEVLIKEGIRRSLSREAAMWYMQAPKKATVREIIKHMDRMYNVMDPVDDLMTKLYDMKQE